MALTVRRMANALVREFQRLWANLAPAQRPPPPEPQDAALFAEVFTWVSQYLARPHEQLGRKGAVCPFAKPALEANQIQVAKSGADGTSRLALRSVLLRHAAGFAARLQGEAANMYASLVVVFPRMPADRFHRLDELHDELKTRLMTSDIMVSSFHPRSEKPALWNPAFRVLRAPFAGFAFRKMDVRDIVFVEHNQRAFAHYRLRFRDLYARGAVSDEHGYATAYAQAVRRFAEG